MIFSTTHYVPSYQAWLDRADLRWVYAAHRRQLQYLQWRCPAERWVLKSPGHLWALDALLAIYPDARIVQTHRDPLKVIASLANLIALLRSMSSDHIDRAAIGAEWTARLCDGMQRSMEVRDHLPPDTAPVFDMHFAEFIRDEIGMVRRIYDHFGLELDARRRGTHAPLPGAEPEGQARRPSLRRSKTPAWTRRPNASGIAPIRSASASRASKRRERSRRAHSH